MELPVTQKEIENGLRELGLEQGDLVIVHSSLSSFGYVEGGADAVVDALLSVIGSEGTLVVPTFSYGQDAFDPETTPSIVGRITEAVRLRPEATRSHHPTHSVAAIGKDAEEIVSGHENTDAFGVGSPLHKILERNGKILQMGVTHTSNSMIHVAEELAGVPYLDRAAVVTVSKPGKQAARRVVRRPGCSRGFDKIEDYLQARDAIRETMIGDSRVRLIAASDVVAAALETLSEDPAALLCETADCRTCAEARAMIAAIRAEEEEERILKEWREQGSFVIPDTGEEYGLLNLEEIPEEGSKNGEDYPD